MLSILSAGAFLTWLIRAALRRSSFLFAMLFLGWTFTLKVLSTVYLDLFGPVFASELQLSIGGSGSSTLWMAIFSFLPMAAIYYFQLPRGAAPPPPESRTDLEGFTIADLIVVVMRIYIFLLFFDLIRIGDIPLFTGAERFMYEGGVFHYVFFNYDWFIAFVAGYGFTRARIVTGIWDTRFIVIIALLFVYGVLTGHRFGAFYVMLSFLGLTMAAFWFARDKGWPVAQPAANVSKLQAFVVSRIGLGTIAAAVVMFIVAAMVNNLLNVRNYGDQAGGQLTERVFVQPVELYWMTWDRMRNNEVLSSSDAIKFMFNDPFDAGRNTGIQYLMAINIGDENAMNRTIIGGQDFAGGYPEILIELGGIWGALFIALCVAIPTGYLYRLVLSSIGRGHLLTALSAFYAVYWIQAVFEGGMLNFVAIGSFWLKFGTLFVALAIDQTLALSGLRLFPWLLIARRRQLPIQSLSI